MARREKTKVSKGQILGQARLEKANAKREKTRQELAKKKIKTSAGIDGESYAN